MSKWNRIKKLKNTKLLVCNDLNDILGRLEYNLDNLEYKIGIQFI